MLETIPSHGWFMTLFELHYCFSHLDHFINSLAVQGFKSLKILRSMDGTSWTDVRTDSISECTAARSRLDWKAAK